MSGISLGRVTTLLLLGRAAGYVLALANSVILARVLGVERLGAYAYAMGLAGLFGLLPNLGIGTVVTRAIARGPEAAAGVVRAAVRAQALAAGAVLLAIPGFAAILPGQPVPLGYVALAAAQLAIGTLSWPSLAVLGGRARYDRVAVAELASGAAGTGLILAAAALRVSVVGFLWAHVAAAGLAVCVAWWVALPFFPAVGTPIRLGALFREATPFGAAAAVQSFYTRLDVLLLGQMATIAALGLYNVAYKPTNLAVYFGATVAGTLFPVLARAPGSAPSRSFPLAVRGLGAAAPAMALAFSGLASPLLRVLYGGEYAAAAPVLILLAWSAAANWLYAPLGVALQARGQERGWLAGLAGALALNGVGNLWAIPRWGAVGAAAATLVSELALLAVGAFLVSQRLGILPSARPVLGGLGATAAGGAVLWALGAAGSVPATLAALTVYGSLLILFRIVTSEDAALVIGWVRQAASGPARG